MLNACAKAIAEHGDVTMPQMSASMACNVNCEPLTYQRDHIKSSRPVNRLLPCLILLCTDMDSNFVPGYGFTFTNIMI
jgi:hypothetical protein